MAIKEELVKAVKEHAKNNYEKGWDTVVECWTDDDILACIDNARTVRGAIYKVNQVVRCHKARRDEIRAEIF